MDILKDLIASQGSNLLGKLSESGFSAEQAEKFLPEAGEGIMNAVSSDKIADLLGGDSGGAISSILSNIDIASLASKAGVDSSLATTGLQAILPQFLETLKGEGGGLLGGIAKIGSSLFK